MESSTAHEAGLGRSSELALAPRKLTNGDSTSRAELDGSSVTSTDTKSSAEPVATTSPSFAAGLTFHAKAKLSHGSGNSLDENADLWVDTPGPAASNDDKGPIASYNSLKKNASIVVGTSALELRKLKLEMAMGKRFQ